MILARKELGKDVGQWFGPSTAAGAIKCVEQYALIIRSDVDMSSEPVHNFPEASLGISIAVDGQIFQTDVYTASLPPTGSPRHHKLSEWGRRAVVVHIDFRLGINGVNPIYYDTINVCGFFAFHMLSPNAFPSALHVPIVDRHSWWPPIDIVLLCWVTS